MTTTTETPAQSGKSPEAKSGRNLFRILKQFGPLLFLIVLMAIFTALKPSFIDPINVFNILRQISITGLIALGMTFVILTAGIDLSVGSLLALCGMVAAIVAKGGTANSMSLSAGPEAGFGWFAALLAALAVGSLAGGVQGVAITRLKVPPFVVTLGGLTIFRGLTLTLSNGGPISGFTPDFRWFGTGLIDTGLKVGETAVAIPVPVIIFASAAIICHIVLRYTRYGRAVYAVGGNAEAARLSGLRVDRILISVYVIVGFFAGLAAFVLSARLNSAEAVAGIGYELTVISAVVIGGTSLFGGIGSVGGTVVGAALIGVLQNGLQFNNVSSYTQSIVIGLILIVAVAFDRWLKSRAARG
jgi:inositol transport system permease protein